MTLMQRLLADLAHAPAQADRLLRLHTPLGPDVLVAERLDGVEAIAPASVVPAGSGAAPAAGMRLTLHALATDAHIELKRLIGQPVLVELLTQASRSELRPFHGHITQAALVGSDGGLARYRLVIEPWLAFLTHRRDSWVFQRQTVQQIVEEVFADYESQGRLAPAWRWDLADANVYLERSLCIQYQETDLDFVQRLLLEEGLFCWWEHRGDASAQPFGSHTLVITDHNGAARPNPQPIVRYTQSGASFAEDSLEHWSRRHSVRSARVDLASGDYRSNDLRPVSQSARGTVAASELTQADTPGAYAYEDLAQGARLALVRMQALDAERVRVRGRGNLRSAAPGSSFTLADHPVHDGSDDQRDRFLILAVHHRARNNLSADQAAHVHGLLGMIAEAPAAGLAHGPRADISSFKADLPNDSDEPVYQCQLIAQPLAVPLRMAVGEAQPRPNVTGVQTALVVGLGEPIHTDRDHRIKVQFHWQRGANSSHRLGSASGDNAPASDASGTWVRVCQPVAGPNWGAVFTPRRGQEVLVAFVQGDIDRPVVIGSLYNGQGQPDAQHNQVASGAAGATGNAPAWFPVSQAQGGLQSHQHTAVLSGYKSQELATSDRGTGGCNQLVFDDSPGAGRIELGSTSAQTRLQLGHLLHQSDNQRLRARGHGLDLVTQAWGAVRAGSGLLISAHGKAASTATKQQLDSLEPLAQVQQSRQLLHALAASAQRHNAKAAAEPEMAGANEEDTTRQLANENGLRASITSLGEAAPLGRSGKSEDGDGDRSGGCLESVSTWARPDLVLSAPGGVCAFTPANSVTVAGSTATFVAGQDLQVLAGKNLAVSAGAGLVFYTYGQASKPAKPNAETGIALHAASGNVSTQSLTAATRLAADQRIEVSSTAGVVQSAAPNHVLLAAAGAAIRIEAGRITLQAPGKIEFRAATKELAGGAAAYSTALTLPTRPACSLWRAPSPGTFC